MSVLKYESAVRSRMIRIIWMKAFCAFPIFLYLISMILTGCQKINLTYKESESVQWKEWFQQSKGAFVGAIVFNDRGNSNMGNSNANSEGPFVGKWDFDRAKTGTSKSLKWIEVPLILGEDKKAIIENISVGSNGLEGDFTKVYLIIYADNKKADTNYILKMISARLPVETKRRLKLLPALKFREVYYNADGSLLADYDNLRGVRSRFVTSLKTTNTVGKQVQNMAITCTVTSTKYSECSVDANYNSICTFYTVSSTRCAYGGDGDANSDYTNNAFLEEGPAGGGGGGISEFTEVEFQNQDNIDSLPQFPCVQEVLSKLPSSDATLAKTIVDLFNISSEINLKLKVKESFDKDSSDGYFRSGTISPYFFNGTIYLNPWVLANSSKDYIASTIMHEGIHAVIGYWFTRYRSGAIDSNDFKSRFPIFWDYKRALSGDELAEHEEFATRFINQLIQYQLMYNPVLSQDMAKALAWGGLQSTTAWKELGADTVSIKEMNQIARNSNSNISSFHIYGLKKCE